MPTTFVETREYERVAVERDEARIQRDEATARADGLAVRDSANTDLMIELCRELESDGEPLVVAVRRVIGQRDTAIRQADILVAERNDARIERDKARDRLRAAGVRDENDESIGATLANILQAENETLLVAARRVVAERSAAVARAESLAKEREVLSRNLGLDGAGLAEEVTRLREILRPSEGQTMSGAARNLASRVGAQRDEHAKTLRDLFYIFDADEFELSIEEVASRMVSERDAISRDLDAVTHQRNAVVAERDTAVRQRAEMEAAMERARLHEQDAAEWVADYKSNLALFRESIAAEPGEILAEAARRVVKERDDLKRQVSVAAIEPIPFTAPFELKVVWVDETRRVDPDTIHPMSRHQHELDVRDRQRSMPGAIIGATQLSLDLRSPSAGEKADIPDIVLRTYVGGTLVETSVELA